MLSKICEKVGIDDNNFFLILLHVEQKFGICSAVSGVLQ